MLRYISIALLVICIIVLAISLHLKDQTIAVQNATIVALTKTEDSTTSETPSNVIAATALTATNVTTATSSGGTSAASLVATPVLPLPPKSEPDYIARVRAVAQAKGLDWQIGCTAYLDEPEHQWIGFAGPPGIRGYYVEEGAVPEWIVQGRTRQEVATKLFRALQRPPNYYPPHGKAKRPDRKCDEEDAAGGPSHQP